MIKYRVINIHDIPEVSTCTTDCEMLDQVQGYHDISGGSVISILCNQLHRHKGLSQNVKWYKSAQ